MKKSTMFVLAVGMLLSIAAKAQKVNNSSVPAPVLAALKAKYPQATKVTWEKEKGNFEANWGGKSGEDMSVVFTPAGELVEQVEAIAPTSLPVAATAYLKSHYSGKKVKETGKVTDAAGKTTYEAEVGKLEIVFDQQGNFIKAGEEND